MTKALWLLHNWGDVWPEVYGPFASEEECEQKAADIFARGDSNDKSGSFIVIHIDDDDTLTAYDCCVPGRDDGEDGWG